MSTSASLLLSHDALPSRIFASPGRMSYLSKSKWMSFRFGFAANSWTGGRDAGVAVDGAGVGAGADAAVIAGRFAQPARTTTHSNRETMIPFRQRLAMIPPFRSRH